MLFKETIKDDCSMYNILLLCAHHSLFGVVVCHVSAATIYANSLRYVFEHCTLLEKRNDDSLSRFPNVYFSLSARACALCAHLSISFRARTPRARIVQSAQGGLYLYAAKLSRAPGANIRSTRRLSCAEIPHFRTGRTSPSMDPAKAEIYSCGAEKYTRNRKRICAVGS